ncbi:hypothetical protein DBZ36_04480 [Alginatibacterium sediminis]|uniref:Uncharacterized protein n=1 Tax=Alginatibacterium sediminis TaxID=2164068 RepID=A0A420EGC7_9ALTE|nr:hypothetical protein [Alginatibacterium sediminis]RKF19720.1 hypothetical protein DBZ36_04480 [Alginatibacterium sediminis]
MESFVIETFLDGVKEDTVKVPLALAKLALRPFLNQLNSEQAEMMDTAIKAKDFEGLIFECEEHDSGEKVVFSIL